MKTTDSPLTKETYSSPTTEILQWENIYATLQSGSPGSFDDQDPYGGEWN